MLVSHVAFLEGYYQLIMRQCRGKRRDVICNLQRKQCRRLATTYPTTAASLLPTMRNHKVDKIEDAPLVVPLQRGVINPLHAKVVIILAPLPIVHE